MSYGNEEKNVTVATIGRGLPGGISEVIRGGLDVFFPRRCAGCGGTIRKIDPSRRLDFFCPPCRRRLSTAPEESCGICGSPGSCGVHEDLDEDDPHADDPHADGSLDGLYWCWVYAPPVQQALTALKFHRLDFLAEGLGTEAARFLDSRLPPVDRVVAVPLHWTRRFLRGYDQAELLARAVASTLELAQVRALRRRRRTAAQSKLGEGERRRNLESAFAVRTGAAVVGKKFLLVDDVTTTGTTLRAAARVLKTAGAAGVYGLAVARTPREKETPSSSSP